MTSSLLTGAGLVSPAAVGCRQNIDVLGRGELVAPPADRSDIPLSEQFIDDALAEQLGELGLDRSAGWRGIGIGIKAGVLAAAEALGTAGLGRQSDRSELGLVVAGHNLAADLAEQYSAKYRTAPDYVPPSAAVRLWDTDSIGLISELFGLRGEVALIGGASASGLIAANHAHRLVVGGVVGSCLVVAPALALTSWQAQAMTAIGAMRRPESHSDDPGRPFDQERAGFVPSQLAAAVILEEPAQARNRGASAIAEQLGAATRLAATSGPEPHQSTERDVILEALRSADLSPSSVDYVNSHGTASPAGDRCELSALAEIFSPDHRPWVNSTKALVGHGLTAAGLFEYVGTAYQLKQGMVHPMPRLMNPLPHPGVRLSCTGGSADLGYAVTASYGFGGIHAAAVLGKSTESENHEQ